MSDKAAIAGEPPAEAEAAPGATEQGATADELHISGRAAYFAGDPRAYWRILVRGAVFLVLTLGLYRFWLATDIRRFLWNNTEVAGDGLEYTGTARELLLGFAVAVLVLVPIYGVLFYAALDLGVIGRLSGLIAFLSIAFLGHFAVYRARRYRLTRTIFRGLRFHQTGSAWRYALRAMFWWAMIIVTLGLAYPFAQASLERYKMSNTFYGDVGGGFGGSGWALFFRGLGLWLLVVGPFLIGVANTFLAVNWTATMNAIGDGTGDVMARIESANPGFFTSLTFSLIALVWAVLAAAFLYPAFQAMMLRWWTSGIRFGDIKIASRLRTAQVYGVYMRFLLYALLFAAIAGAAGAVGLLVIGVVNEMMPKSKTAEAVTTAMVVGAYVITALAYSTIYQATVKLNLWRLGFETAEFSDMELLEHVNAVGGPSSPFGEGLADALHVGGI